MSTIPFEEAHHDGVGVLIALHCTGYLEVALSSAPPSLQFPGKVLNINHFEIISTSILWHDEF